MNQKELKQHLIEDIVTIKDNLDLPFPCYAADDAYPRKIAVAAPILESKELVRLMIKTISTGLQDAKYGKLTRTYITATVACLKRWVVTWADREDVPSHEATLQEYNDAVSKIPEAKFNPHAQAYIKADDLKSITSHLDSYGSTIMRASYLHHYSLDALAKAITKAYGRPVTVHEDTECFEPMDLPDYHELVKIGVYKLRRPVLPALVVKIQKA